MVSMLGRNPNEKGQAAIFDTVSAIMAKHGYKRDGQTWRKENAETVSVLELQESDWGRSYYVNAAVGLKACDLPDRPQEHQCHIRARLDCLAGSSDELTSAFDLENKKLTERDRRERVALALEAVALPFLHRLSSREGIERFVRSDEAAHVLISKRLRTCVAPGNDTGY